jgi:hypothetical protein
MPDKKASKHVFQVTYQVENIIYPPEPVRGKNEPQPISGRRQDDPPGPVIKRFHGGEKSRLVMAYTPEGAVAFVRAEETVGEGDEVTTRVLRASAALVLANVDDIAVAPEKAPAEVPEPDKPHSQTRAEAKADRAVLENMNKSELIAQATSEGIELTQSMTREEMIHDILDKRKVEARRTA